MFIKIRSTVSLTEEVLLPYGRSDDPHEHWNFNKPMHDLFFNCLVVCMIGSKQPIVAFKRKAPKSMSRTIIKQAFLKV